MDQHRVAIVCSARSGTTKALGTTNLLLMAASEALDVRKPAFATAATGTTTPFTHQVHQNGSRDSSPPSTSLSRNGSISNRSGGASRPGSPCSLAPLTPAATPFPNGVSNSNGNGNETLSATTTTFPFPAFYKTIDLIRADHLQAARQSVRDPELLAELEGEIEQDCYRLQQFLSATRVSTLLLFFQLPSLQGILITTAYR